MEFTLKEFFLDKKQFNESTICPICDQKSSIVDTIQTINPNSNETVKLRECSYCKHWWVDPLPNQKYLSFLYENNSEYVVHKGWSEGIKQKEVNLDILMQYASQIFRFLPKKEKYDYLEIGVGSGHLFNYFEKKSNFCYGVEPGTWKLNNPNIVSDISQIPKGIKFDIIVIHDVLEHLKDPINMLILLREFAKKECIISCCSPNRNSLWAKIFRGKWRMVMPYGHLHFFSSKSITKAFEKTGWKITIKFACRPAMLSVRDSIRNFDWKISNPIKLAYNLVKILFVVQILLGKDQWYVQGKA